MAEKPILFSDPMVLAILGGAKTQTRRVVKGCEFVKKTAPGIAPYWRLLDHPNKPEGGGSPMGAHLSVLCPYGQPGDRLWVREAFFDTTPYSNAPLFQGRQNPVAFRADGEIIGCHRWKPSIHMPRWASRILLEITAVRVERLQDISEADAIAEGIEGCLGDYMAPGMSPGEGFAYADGRGAYRHLWESINGPASWSANPWVWVIEFKRLEQSNA